MEKRDWTWMYASKANEVLDILHILRSFDDETRVKSMEYSHDEKTKTEYVVINYFDRSPSVICVNMNSEGAIFREIMKEIYGSGAIGARKRDEDK